MMDCGFPVRGIGALDLPTALAALSTLTTQVDPAFGVTVNDVAPFREAVLTV